MTTYQTNTFFSQDGYKLFECAWRLAEPKASVVMVHGYSEHCGRYAHLAETLNEHGYDVFAFDQYGYGQSEGERAMPESFDVHARDITHMVKRVRQMTDKKRPVYLFAHSMGALCTLYALETAWLPVQGLVTSGVATRVGGNVPKPIQTVLKAVGKVASSVRLPTGPGGEVSRDPAVNVRFQADPYTYKGGVPLRVGMEFRRVGPYVETHIGRVTIPVNFMHGTADQIAAHQGSVYLYENVGSADKTLSLYPGMYHELVNEYEQDEVMADIVAWYDRQVETYQQARASHHQKRTKRKKAVTDDNPGKVG